MTTDWPRGLEMERDRRWGSGKDYRTTAALLRICWVLGPWRIGPSDVRPRHRSCRTGRRNRPVGSGCQGAPRRRLGGVLILTQSEAHLFLREGSVVSSDRRVPSLAGSGGNRRSVR